MTGDREGAGPCQVARETGADQHTRRHASDRGVSEQDGAAVASSGGKTSTPARIAPSGWPMVHLVAVVGGVAAGLAGAAAIGSGAPVVPYLMQVGTDEVDAAARSLIGPGVGAMADDAKSCRQPLAYVVVRGTGSPGGYVQFRSGAYLSPRLTVGMMSERLALPFPAPYITGRGQITVVNASQGADVFLVPGSRLSAASGTTVLPVRWSVRPGGC